MAISQHTKYVHTAYVRGYRILGLLVFLKEQLSSLRRIQEPKPAGPEGPTNRILPFSADVPSIQIDTHSAHWGFYATMVVDVRDRIFLLLLL